MCIRDRIVNIEFSSFAQRTDLLDQDGSWIEVNPSQPLQFGPLFQDTSFQIRLRHEGWDCDTIAVCSIRVEQANTTLSLIHISEPTRPY